MRRRIVLLGTGTCQLERERMASSVLVELGSLRIVFDLGRGATQRLVDLGLRQNEIRHLVLSHYHPDHFSDLIAYLWAALYSQTDARSEDLHIWGPPGLSSVMAHIEALIERRHFEEQERFAVELHEAGAGEISIEGVVFGRPSLPPAGNLGLTFAAGGVGCALTGDSHFHEPLLEALKGKDFAVIDSGHLSDDEIVEAAVVCQVPRLVCSHLYRQLDAAALNAQAQARGYAGKILIGSDLQIYDLS